MGKRSDFDRIGKDFYKTPYGAVVPLAQHLPSTLFTFCEPCAGDGRLISHLETAIQPAKCVAAYDIDLTYPRYKGEEWGIEELDARRLTADHVNDADFIITNPPWSRDKKSGYLLHRLIETFVEIAPTWLLFDADWAHTAQAQPYTSRWCSTIVAIGRVKWFEDTNMSGKDNTCWYLFEKDARQKSAVPEFWGKGFIK